MTDKTTTSGFRIFPSLIAFVALILQLPAQTISQTIPFDQQPAAVLAGSSEWGEWMACKEVQRRVRVLDTDLIIGEPVVLEFQMKGLNRFTKTSYEAPFQLGQDIFVWIDPPQAQPYQLEMDYTVPLSLGSLWKLNFNETVETYQVLGHDPQSVLGSLFDRAGAYDIYVGHRCDTGDPEMLGKFGVNVAVGDDNPQDSFARNVLSHDFENFQSIHATIVIDPNHLLPMQKVYEQAEDSTLWPWAATSYASYLRGTDADENVDQAISIFREIMNNHQGHYLEYIAFSRLVDALRFAGREDEARQEIISARSRSVLARRILAGDPGQRWMFGDEKNWLDDNWTFFQQPVDGFYTEADRSGKNWDLRVKAELHRQKKIEIVIWDDLERKEISELDL